VNEPVDHGGDKQSTYWIFAPGYKCLDLSKSLIGLAKPFLVGGPNRVWVPHAALLGPVRRWRYDGLVIEEGRGHTNDTGFEIRPMVSDDMESVLRVLTDTFGTGFDHDWFTWKHREGPWGPSPGWVAQDGSGLLGVRLLLPWRFREGDRVYRAHRPCDTVTAPEARGRGVFRSLTEHAISSLEEDVDFLFNTPNTNSKPGYLKMGFVEWGEVRQRLSLIWPRRAELTDDPDPTREEAGVRTDADRRFLTWRYDTCPGRDYRLLGLAGETGNGLVCRIRLWRGMRLMVVSELWGHARQRTTLINGAAHEVGARLAWFGEPFPHTGFPSLTRPGTSVTRYDLRSPEPGPLSLSLGDVEDVL
jgi:hypothetical protein